MPRDPTDLASRLEGAGYLASESLALTAWLALTLKKPLLVEGPAGVGKTELARALADALERPYLRLQCYEGLNEARALYDWDYAKQILYTQLLRDRISAQIANTASIREAAGALRSEEDVFFSRHFLVARPILRALESDVPAVLLLDEIDRADPDFEALLLEVLADNRITIPELGPIDAKHPPLVILTTNGTREMTDALRRRCLHAYVDYPPPSVERRIVEMRVPGIAKDLADQLTAFVEKVRELDLRKAPGISETVDWARSIVLLGGAALDPELARSTLGALAKYAEDRDAVGKLIDAKR